MKFDNLPDKKEDANILGFGPDIQFDKDRYSKNYGYGTFDALKKAGKTDFVKMIESAEESFNRNKREISPWMESHVQIVDTLHDLVDAVNTLESQNADLVKRIEALESKG